MRFDQSTSPCGFVIGVLHQACWGEFSENFSSSWPRRGPLVNEFTLPALWPAVRRARSLMHTDPMFSFLSEAHDDGRQDNQSGRRWCRYASPAAFSVSLGLSNSFGKV